MQEIGNGKPQHAVANCLPITALAVFGKLCAAGNNPIIFYS
jgi:hypothetical protein